MTRLASAIKTDSIVQVRNNYYSVAVAAGITSAAVLSQLVGADSLSYAVPVIVLLVTGGTAMLYVMGLIIFEKDEGTLCATIVSPLRVAEYLWSKILTLSVLALFETVIAVGGAILIISRSSAIDLPIIPLLVLGVLAIGVIYTLAGIILVVRYDKITAALVPMGAIGAVLQVPALYFLGWFDHSVFLLVPTSAPTMLMQGAFVPLETWEWVYAVTVTALMVAALATWAHRAFRTHVVMGAR